jgi:hypothetical protein
MFVSRVFVGACMATALWAALVHGMVQQLLRMEVLSGNIMLRWLWSFFLYIYTTHSCVRCQRFAPVTTLHCAADGYGGSRSSTGKCCTA